MRLRTDYIFGLLFLTIFWAMVDHKATITAHTYNSTIQKSSPDTDSLLNSIHLTDGNIIGNWTNCETTSGGLTATANVCRTIEFKKDNSAVITYPSKEKQVINWTISNDQLVINLTGNKSDAVNRTLTDSIYETYLTQDNLGFHLELKAKNKDLIYYLEK